MIPTIRQASRHSLKVIINSFKTKVPLKIVNILDENHSHYNQL